MQKLSSFGRKKKKQAKIRHRMVMLRFLQFIIGHVVLGDVQEVCRVPVKLCTPCHVLGHSIIQPISHFLT